MNASDPVDLAEVAKAKALQHDVEVNEKHPELHDDMAIEPAPVTSIPTDGEDETLDKIYPTDEELQTLRRISGNLHWTIFTVAFVELCERFSYYGTTAVCKYSVTPRWRNPVRETSVH